MTTMPKDAKAARAILEDTRPAIPIGSEVTVEETGIAPWTGIVAAFKPSLVSGWWGEVRDDRGTWVIHASRLRRRDEEG